MKGWFLRGFMLAAALCWGYSLSAQTEEWARLQRNLQFCRLLEGELQDMQMAYTALEASYERLVALYREERWILEREEHAAFQVEAQWREDPLVQTMSRRLESLKARCAPVPGGEENRGALDGSLDPAWKRQMREALAREEEWRDLLLRSGALRLEPSERWRELLRLADRIKSLETEYRRQREHQLWRQEWRRREEAAGQLNPFFYDQDDER